MTTLIFFADANADFFNSFAALGRYGMIGVLLAFIALAGYMGVSVMRLVGNLRKWDLESDKNKRIELADAQNRFIESVGNLAKKLGGVEAIVSHNEESIDDLENTVSDHTRIISGHTAKLEEHDRAIHKLGGED